MKIIPNRIVWDDWVDEFIGIQQMRGYHYSSSKYKLYEYYKKGYTPSKAVKLIHEDFTIT